MVQLGLSKMSLESPLITDANMKEVFEAKFIHKGFPPTWVEDTKEQLWTKYVKEIQNEKENRLKAEVILNMIRHYLLKGL